MPERLSLTDRAAVRQWVADLRVAVADLEGVAEDVLRPLRRRDLGHREHRRIFGEAKEKVAAMLDFIDPPGGSEPDAEPHDPSGSGASPVH